MTMEEILKKYAPTRDNILYILHDIQDSSEQHFLTPDDLKAVSSYIQVPLSYVQGVVSFYSMFSIKPRGRYIIRLCESPPCHMMGEVNIKETLEKKLGIRMGETTPDNMFTLEFSSCLGTCAVAPVMMVNNEVYGNLTPGRVEEIIKTLGRQP